MDVDAGITTPPRSVYRDLAEVHIELSKHDADDSTDTDRIVSAINGLTFAMLALSADEEPDMIVAPIVREPEPEIDPVPVERGDVVDYDGVGTADWLCLGCSARRSAESWMRHIHAVSVCTDTACREGRPGYHAHLSRDNITRGVGGVCTATDCMDREYEHAHWFTEGQPDRPGQPVWLVKR